VNDIESDATAGNLGHPGSGGEPRKEEEIQEFGIAQPPSHVSAGMPPLDDFAAKPLEIDPAAIVGDGDRQQPSTMSGHDADPAHLRFSGRLALVGRLQAVIQCVAHKVIQRGVQPLQDVAVDLGGLSLDVESNALAKLSRQVANQPRQSLHAISKRSHAAGDDLAIQTSA